MMKTLTVNVDLDIEGDDNFIDLIGEIIGEKKNLKVSNNLSLWEYEPDVTVKSVKVDKSSE